MALQPQLQNPISLQGPQSPSSDYIPSMRMTADSPTKTISLYEFEPDQKDQKVLVHYFSNDDITTKLKVGTITEINNTFSMFGKKYTVKSGNDNTENVNKVYTTDRRLGTGDPVKVQVVQLDARGGGRRRKSKKVFKNKNKNKNKKRNSRKSSKRSRRH